MNLVPFHNYADEQSIYKNIPIVHLEAVKKLLRERAKRAGWNVQYKCRYRGPRRMSLFGRYDTPKSAATHFSVYKYERKGRHDIYCHI